MAETPPRYWKKPEFRHYLEYIPVWLATRTFQCLPVDLASNIVGALGRLIGPRLSLSKRARENLHLVWPDMSSAETERLIRGLWDNFARVPNDYWNLHKIRADRERRIEIVGAEHLDALTASGRPGILFSGHMGDWEMATLAARMRGLDLTVVYRPFNNPFIDGLVRGWQRKSGIELVMKGRDGARRLTQVLRSGGHTFMLVDVRMNDGIPVPFFGIEAMTPSAPAALAMKYDALLVPMRTERIGPARFRVTIEEPRPAVSTGDRAADMTATMTWVNGRIEAWVRDRPEQWMWLHRRWGKRPKRPGPAAT